MSIKNITFIFLYQFVILLISFNASASIHQYQVKVHPQLNNLEVNICFDGSAPDYLVVESRKGNQDLIELPDSNQGNIEIQGRYWYTGNLAKNACLKYKVNIERHLASNRRKMIKNVGEKPIAFIQENTWLWLPEKLATHDDIEINMLLPTGIQFSTPWRQKDQSGSRFILGHQPGTWGYTLVLGDFSQRFSTVSFDRRLSIASLKNLPNSDAVDQWLTDTAKSLENYLGDYPVAQTQVVVIFKARAKAHSKHGPVPWGEVNRGNGFALQLVIDPSYPIADFYADWTASHEFSHQLLPKIDYDDIWLSEGLASYLQYVLMGQSGALSSEQAWLRLYKGLQRGEKGTQSVTPEPLHQTSSHRRHGSRSGRTMRIYWSGALYFLKADVALRQNSQGKVGLNHILLKLNRCCINSSKIWRGEKLAKQLDRLSESAIFSRLFVEFSENEKFPDYQATYAQLGIKLPSRQRTKIHIQADSLAEKIMQ